MTPRGGDDPQGGGGGSLIPPSSNRPQFYACQADKAETFSIVGDGFAYSCVEAAERLAEQHMRIAQLERENDALRADLLLWENGGPLP